VKRRVVVTGVGVIAPNGGDAVSFWASLVNGVSGIGPITLFDASTYPTRIAGEVKGFDPAGFMDRKQAKRMARFSQFAVVCARMAVADAGLDEAALKRLDPLLSLGVSGTDVGIVEEQQTAFLKGGLRRVNPFSSFMSLPNAAAGEVAGAVGVRGPNVTVSTGCASGLDAVGAAYRAVALGERRAAIAGGADAPVTP